MIMAMHLLKSNCLTTISCKDIINWVLRLLGLIVNRYNYMDKTGSNRSAASNNDKFDNKNDIENDVALQSRAGEPEDVGKQASAIMGAAGPSRWRGGRRGGSEIGVRG